MIPLPLDPGIQEMQEKIEWIQGNPDLFRAYLRYEKAASDEVNRINGARREGLQEGLQQRLQEGLQEGFQQGRMEVRLDIAAKLKKRGWSVDQIAEVAGLSAEEIAAL